jgi:hypothetical protein
VESDVDEVQDICHLYTQSFNPDFFTCGDTPDLSTAVYTDSCRIPTPGKRSLSSSAGSQKRHTKNPTGQSQSNGEDVTGSGFDSYAASHEGQFKSHIDTSSVYFGLPPFEENIAVALASSTSSEGTNSTQPTTPDGFTTLFDTSKKIQLAALDSGVLTLAAYGSGSLFGVEEDVVVTDSGRRYFVYFPDAIASKGVSRIHLVTANSVPQGSEILGLVEVPTSVGNVYAAFSTKQKGQGYFLLAWCNVDYGSGPSPKVFLVNDYGQALTTLANPDLVYTIIGGVVIGQCAPLELTSDVS